jgi:hypothetical protein
VKGKSAPVTSKEFIDDLCELDETLIQNYGWSLFDIDNTEADHMFDFIRFIGRKYSKKEQKSTDGSTYKTICGRRMKKVDADHCNWL